MPPTDKQETNRLDRVGFFMRTCRQFSLSVCQIFVIQYVTFRYVTGYFPELKAMQEITLA